MAEEPSSPPAASPPAADNRLDSWKEIAAYFKREVRTVQLWEKTEELPVHRHQHRGRPTVYAYKAELDAWWSARQPEAEQEEKEIKLSSRRNRPLLAAAGLTLLVVAGVGLWWDGTISGSSEAPSRVQEGIPEAAVRPGAPSAAADETQFNIRAYIDGRSRLVLHGRRAWWYHLDWSAPGRLRCYNYATQINGANWFPFWPDEPTCENAFCKCESSIFREVRPILPERPQTARLEVVQARQQVKLLEAPSMDNYFNVVIEFNDNNRSGADWYEVNLFLGPLSATAPSVSAPRAVPSGQESPPR